MLVHGAGAPCEAALAARRVVLWGRRPARGSPLRSGVGVQIEVASRAFGPREATSCELLCASFLREAASREDGRHPFAGSSPKNADFRGRMVKL